MLYQTLVNFELSHDDSRFYQVILAKTELLIANNMISE